MSYFSQLWPSTKEPKEPQNDTNDDSSENNITITKISSEAIIDTTSSVTKG